MKIKYFSRAINIEKLFMQHREIYAIDSLFPGIWYAADDTEFAIIRNDGYIICPRSDVPKMAWHLVPEIREEVLEIYNEIEQ